MIHSFSQVVKMFCHRQCSRCDTFLFLVVTRRSTHLWHFWCAKFCQSSTGLSCARTEAKTAPAIVETVGAARKQRSELQARKNVCHNTKGQTRSFQCREYCSHFGRILCIDPVSIDVYKTGIDADSCRKWTMPWSIRLDEPGPLHS